MSLVFRVFSNSQMNAALRKPEAAMECQVSDPKDGKGWLVSTAVFHVPIQLDIDQNKR